jgi:hypothetical protein
VLFGRVAALLEGEVSSPTHAFVTLAIIIGILCLFAVLGSDILAVELLQQGNARWRRVLWKASSAVATLWVLPVVLGVSALLTFVQERYNWFTGNAVGEVVGALVLVAMIAAGAFESFKGIPERYRERIFTSLEFAVGESDRRDLNARKDGMLSGRRDQFGIAVDAVLTRYAR